MAVGSFVAAVGRLVGGSSCGPSEPTGGFAVGGDCARLVASVAGRMGVAAGMATVLVTLLAAGLARTAARMEEERRVAPRDGATDEW